MLSNANKEHFHRGLPSWNNFMAHPNYDEYWKGISVLSYLEETNVPTLNVAGWWDAEDFYGPMKIYDILEKNDLDNLNYLVVGPWRHGGWARDEGDTLFEIEFDSKTSDYYRKNIEAPWFAYHLKEKGIRTLPEVQAFQTGTNIWENHDVWPPQNKIAKRKIFFCADNSLSFEKPVSENKKAFDSYISDPDRPVPYTKRPMPGFWQGAQAKWKVEDQRFVHLRPDVVSWETNPLQEDITVSGRIIAHLFASTSGTDSDWIVKLIDVYPENYQKKPELSGYQLMIADDVLRGKFRNSLEIPEPVPAGKVVEYVIDLNSRNHCFLKGHKIMVQVQSTWFPLIGRNPQKFIDIPDAKTSDYQKAAQKIYRSNRFPSHIIIPVVDE